MPREATRPVSSIGTPDGSPWGARNDRRDDLDKLERIDRLDDMALKSGGEGMIAVGGAGVGGERNRGQVGTMQRSDPAQQRVAVFARQPDVGDQQVGPH